ncbi:MAG: aspartate aminotransferase family protein [Flavobacteriia bacterium]|nr:aspartate aminotransferase family protein [Flavobacteriia bacterium]
MTHQKHAHWRKLTHEEITSIVFEALDKNIDYRQRKALGVPASHLDERVFYNNPMLLQNAPFLSTLLQNPNHIGCHTIGESEPFFAGTQRIEKELIQLCAEDILKGESDAQDGYVAAGGTEANIQAIWVFRNYFMSELNLQASEVGLLFSEDSHYSMFKAANLLQIPHFVAKVNEGDRTIDERALAETIESMKKDGIKAVAVVANMMTTMFGSADNPDVYVNALKNADLPFKLHLDGAYGGFVFPFVSKDERWSFANTDVSSITLDAHKMVQAPYGTGIYLAKKGLIPYATTGEAQYVAGLDATLSGSRSGANAISVWMILQTYGPNGWFEKIHLLSYRADWLERQLNEIGIEFYRYPGSNIVTMRSHSVPKELVEKYGLVPDSHEGNANWYKVVIMDHVSVDDMVPFVEELQAHVNG